jgi:hypothetical protein
LGVDTFGEQTSVTLLASSTQLILPVGTNIIFTAASHSNIGNGYSDRNSFESLDYFNGLPSDTYGYEGCNIAWDPTTTYLTWYTTTLPPEFVQGQPWVIATAVPEPSTLVLLGIGAVSLLAYTWRRRRA